MSFNATYWFARGYYDGRSKGMEDDHESIPEEYLFSYKSGYESGVTDFCEFDEDNYESSYDGQPDEAQEWHDFDPDC